MGRNICPRSSGDSNLGTALKKWGTLFVNTIEETNFIARLATALASSAATTISSLNTSSLFYRMLSWALSASGVLYNFTNSSAWYICFGSLLGGLIIQGGIASYSGATYEGAEVWFEVNPTTMI